MIFTSPSSARGDLGTEALLKPQGRRNKTFSKRPPVAVKIGMDDKVTARAIAYTAVQVCRPVLLLLPYLHHIQLHFALNDATHWMSHYSGFNYREFYEFMISKTIRREKPALLPMNSLIGGIGTSKS